MLITKGSLFELLILFLRASVVRPSQTRTDGR